MSRMTAFLLFCAALLAFEPASAQQEYTLQYKFQSGKTYLFADTITANATQEMMGQEMKSVSRVRAVTRAVASELRPDGSTVLTISPDSLSVNIKSPQMDTTLVPREVIGKRTRLTVSRLGNVVRRETVDSAKLTGLSRSFAQRELVRFHEYPSKPVKIGGKWSTSRPDTNESMGGKVVTLSAVDYTLEGKETRNGSDQLKISFVGKLTLTGKGTMMGNNFYLEGTGKTAGTFFVDAATGLASSEQTTMEMESTVALTGQQNMTIPSSQSVTTHRVLLNP